MRRLAPLWPLAPFAALATLDWGLALASIDGRAPQAPEWSSLLQVWALWLLAGTVAWAGWSVALAVALTPEERERARQWFRHPLGRMWSARNTAHSREQAARCAGVLAGGLFLAATSVASTAQLVAHRHGPLLIAITALALQLLWAAPAAVVGASVRRVHRALARRLARRGVPEGAFSLPALVLGVLGAGLVLAVAAASRTWETLVSADAGAPALALMACLLLLVAWSRSPAPDRVTLGIVGLLLVACVLLLSVGFPAGSGRSLVSSRTTLAKYLLSGVQRASDFDRDGTPMIPGAEDCAPFDPSRHPFATEVPGNGVDENCDGSDVFSMERVMHSRREEPSRRITPTPNLLLITTDATRADHMGFLGYDRHPTTPNLDVLARESVVFSAAFSLDSGTGPSTWSLMTGRTPFQVTFSNASKFPFDVHAREVLLAEALKKGGYTTAAVLCGSMFRPGKWNISRGFDHWHEPCGARVNFVADRTAGAALKRLQSLPPDRPYFLWVHMLDPHHPYSDHPDLHFGPSKIDHYDEEIHKTDAAVARIVESARSLSSRRPLFVAVTADHGENFGEHGNAPHARTLYREVTNVPLLIHGPDVVPRHVDTVVASPDLYPTLLDLAGLPIPERSTMVSQFNVLFGAEPDHARLVFQENSFSRPRRHVRAVVSNEHHLIFDMSNRVWELYNWRRDPAEKRNLIDEGVPEAPSLQRALLRFLTTSKIPDEIRN